MGSGDLNIGSRPHFMVSALSAEPAPQDCGVILNVLSLLEVVKRGCRDGSAGKEHLLLFHRTWVQFIQPIW